MTTPNTDFLLNFRRERIARLQIAARQRAPLTVLPIASLSQSSRQPYGKADSSTPFLMIVALLALATSLFFWNEQRELARRNTEIDRQNRVASQVYHAITRYTDSPNASTDHEARMAIDLASEEHLTENRQVLLSNFYRSAKRCHVGGKYRGSAEDCRQMACNRFSAMSAEQSDDLDNDQ
jgi:hypothetical protein